MGGTNPLSRGSPKGGFYTIVHPMLGPGPDLPTSCLPDPGSSCICSGAGQPMYMDLACCRSKKMSTGTGIVCIVRRELCRLAPDMSWDRGCRTEQAAHDMTHCMAQKLVCRLHVSRAGLLSGDSKIYSAPQAGMQHYSTTAIRHTA